MKVLQINAVYNLSSTGRNVTESHLLMLERALILMLRIQRLINLMTRIYIISVRLLMLNFMGCFQEFQENKDIFLI